MFLQGYERVRRVSEDDGSAAPSYEDEEEEEEGFDEVTGRESLPKQVREYCHRINHVNNVENELSSNDIALCLQPPVKTRATVQTPFLHIDRTK